MSSQDLPQSSRSCAQAVTLAIRIEVPARRQDGDEFRGSLAQGLCEQGLIGAENAAVGLDGWGLRSTDLFYMIEQCQPLRQDRWNSWCSSPSSDSATRRTVS